MASTTLGDLHPSNRLYRGEITDPKGAIDAHIACLRIEQRQDVLHPVPEMEPFDWAPYIAEVDPLIESMGLEVPDPLAGRKYL